MFKANGMRETMRCVPIKMQGHLSFGFDQQHQRLVFEDDRNLQPEWHAVFGESLTVESLEASSTMALPTSFASNVDERSGYVPQNDQRPDKTLACKPVSTGCSGNTVCLMRPGAIALVRLSRDGFETTSITETVTLTFTEEKRYQVAMRQLDVIVEGTVRDAEHHNCKIQNARVLIQRGARVSSLQIVTEGFTKQDGTFSIKMRPSGSDVVPHFTNQNLILQCKQKA
jgi:hypothetical protein